MAKSYHIPQEDLDMLALTVHHNRGSNYINTPSKQAEGGKKKSIGGMSLPWGQPIKDKGEVEKLWQGPWVSETSGPKTEGFGDSCGNRGP